MGVSACPVSRTVSGGQTGVDRAALDVALELGIPCGGWCPKWRLAEDGPLPHRYPLQEAASRRYSARTRLNVSDSDATLVLNAGELEGGTAETVQAARRIGKPCLLVDLAANPDLAAVHAWLREHDGRVLNVAGPRESKRPGIHGCAAEFLRALLAGARE
jgi:hypothetical protein